MLLRASLLPHPVVALSALVGGAVLSPRLASAAPEAEASASVSTQEGSKKEGSKWKEHRAQEQAEAAEERKKPWMQRWTPENNEVDVGMYLGLFVVGRNHGLYNPSLGSQPRLYRAAFDLGFRATYFPLKYVGAGFEGGFAPTRSPELAERATVGAFRVHVMGQLPYRVTPTLVIGGGLLNMTSPDPRLRATDGAFHWGAGVKLHINKWLAIRLDGRHMVTGNGNNGRAASHGEITVGLDVTLRFKRILSRDRDGDGVPDRRDKCPDVPGDGADGCPTDRDRDGVLNESDACPDVWGDQPNGCPSADTDGDGIVDTKDQCVHEPETFNQFQDDDGCPDERPKEIEEFNGVIKGILFDFNKATIRKSSYELLDRAVEVLKKYPELRLEISGHTDSVGSREANLSLSEQRADAVKAYLVEHGVDDARLETRGAGPDEPVADNKTNAGRSENRRIEFKLQGAP